VSFKTLLMKSATAQLKTCEASRGPGSPYDASVMPVQQTSYLRLNDALKQKSKI
jgi:hypothetical protein